MALNRQPIAQHPDFIERGGRPTKREAGARAKMTAQVARHKAAALRYRRALELLLRGVRDAVPFPGPVLAEAVHIAARVLED